MSEKIATETVYVTTNEDNRVMSDKVQSLAGSIYKEFEKVIKQYDEDVVKDLMPLVVGILEALDAAFAEKQELEVELELLREDNEQLLTQYEREKQLRKAAEQKYLELEDNMEGIKKELEEKVETLESIIRMSEIKSKNSADLVSRLEEREQEAKNEYNKLHDRYTELFRTHMDYMERTKVLLGTDKLSEMIVTTTGPRTMKGGISTHHANVAHGNIIELHNPDSGTPIHRESGTHQTGSSNVSLRTELDAQAAERGDREQLTDSINVAEKAMTTRLNKTLAEIIATTPELTESHDSLRSQGYLEQPSGIHNDSSVFEEIQATDIAEVDFSTGISDSDKEDDDEEEEDEDEEGKDNDRDSVGDNFFGMCRELENLILENTELLATKNALNVVKDDLIAKIDILTSEQDVLREEIVIHNSVRKKLQDRIFQLEEELKKFKEELEKKDQEQNEKEEEEGDVPMAQRKRFTRVEMARVLMERNQYKERLMELQEAVRWTEMMRASKEHPGELQAKKKSGVWNFFGNLFSSTSKPKTNVPVAAVKHTTPAAEVQSRGDLLKKQRGSVSKSSSSEDFTSETAKKEREKERTEQYKQVRALVKKDDGRMQAYGWSLPAKFTISLKETSEKFQVPVPVPVYCRPLFESQTDWKIWCAAGVDLTGGKTRRGGRSVGETGDYHSEHSLEDIEAGVKNVDTQQMSSLVWVCTSKQDSSQVSVIDANNPADILENFLISGSHILCITSVPGALDSDYPVPDEETKAESPETTVVATDSSTGVEAEAVAVGGVTFIQCAAGEDPLTKSVTSLSEAESDNSMKIEDDNSHDKWEDIKDGKFLEGQTATRVRAVSRSSPLAQADDQDVEVERMSSALPTMWLGTHSGSIYVHSSVTNWKRCLHSARLKDSILGIVHVRGRVLVSMADGTVAIFHRSLEGEWDLQNYHLLDLGQGQPKQSIRCMTVVDGKRVWCGYKNKIHIISPMSMAVEKSFDAHPRKESQVRHLCWVGDGVWVSIRLDSTLRLYHAHTHQHLQDVDVEPYVSKMLGTGKLGFSFVRTTAMLVSCNRLWIGTSNGVIISVPLSENNKQPMIATSTNLDGPSGGWPGGIVRVYSDTSLESAVSRSFIPYCSMTQAQLSFHGHKDAVKFFVSVPGAPKQGTNTDSEFSRSGQSAKTAVPAPPSNSQLILSGGEGYIDFRMGDGEDGDAAATSSSMEIEEGERDDDGAEKAQPATRLDSSHIIVWQVTTQG